MNILIIDDDSSKKMDIANQLKLLDPEAKIRWFNNYQDASLFISDNVSYIDLIVLDWCFPADSYSRSQYGMGKQVLSYMKYNDFSNNVIICSADYVKVNTDEFPFVIGTVMYDSYESNIDDFSELLNIEKKDENKGIARTLQPKKPDSDSGYKRHKSSTPWWRK